MSAKDRVYINCPFNEKDDAKSLGAKWDGGEKKWFIPPENISKIQDFHKKWRILLDCPFTGKDQVKAKGAKWEPQLKKWFIPAGAELENFRMWLPQLPTNGSSKNVNGSRKNDKPATKKRKASNENGNTQNKKSKTPQKAKAKKKVSSSSVKGAPTSDCSSNIHIKLSSLPRITASLTKPKLSYELHHRSKESVSGSSNKPKEWFLNKLGVGSIWETSSEARAVSDFSNNIPKVGKSMTIAHLSHELLERKPDIKGMSGKNKDWFLEQLGIGSICITSAKTNEIASPAVPTKKVSVDSISISTKSTEKMKGKSKINCQALPNTSVNGKKTKKESETKQKKSEIDVDVLVPLVSSKMTVAELKEEYKTRNPKETGYSSKRKEWFLEQLRPGSKRESSMECKIEEKNDLSSETIKTASAAKVAAPKRTIKKSVNKSSSHSDTRSKVKKVQSESEAKVRKLIKKLQKSSSPSVSSEMTIAELRDEYRARHPNEKGFSSKGKDWLLEHLTIGSPRQASAERQLEQEKDNTEVSAIVKKKESSTPMKKLEGAVNEKENEKTGNIKVNRSQSEKSKQTASSKSLSKASSSKLVKTSTKHELITENATKLKGDKVVINIEEEKDDDIESGPPSIPLVSPKMTVLELRAEYKARYPNTSGLTAKGKAWFLQCLEVGTEREYSQEWQLEQDKRALKLHTHFSLCHEHPLADSNKLRPVANPVMMNFGTRSTKKRSDSKCSRCNGIHFSICTGTSYRTCEKCNFDICKACFDIESLPEPEKTIKVQAIQDRLAKEVAEQHKKARKERAERQRRYEEEAQRRRLQMEQEEKQRKEEKMLEMQRLFPVKNPKSRNRDIDDKLSFIVWKSDKHYKQDWVRREFDSSFDTLEEANLRAEYVFFYNHPSGCKKDAIYVNTDKMIGEGMKFLESNSEDGSGTWTVSVAPRMAFDYLNIDTFFENYRGEWKTPKEVTKKQFAANIRDPKAKNKNKDKKLKYTVWSFNENTYECYEGAETKTFDSTFDTLKEASQRVEYVFWFNNPWGYDSDEMYIDKDCTTKDGLRMMQYHPDGYDNNWTVSVLPSIAFDYISEVSVASNSSDECHGYGGDSFYGGVSF